LAEENADESLDLGVPYSQRNVAGKGDENPQLWVMKSLWGLEYMKNNIHNIPRRRRSI
jgi:hypothetical protein